MHRTTPIQLAVLLTFGFMLTIGSTMIAALQLKPGLAYCKLRDLDWYRTASPRVQRETAHQALAFWFGDPHDAFAILERFGDRSSIPHLRAALAKQPLRPSRRGHLYLDSWAPRSRTHPTIPARQLCSVMKRSHRRTMVLHAV